MSRERFAEILKEYDYSDEQIELLWNNSPTPPDNLDEQRLRRAAEFVAPMKDTLRQA